jgi:hypothetical protein
MRYVERPGGRHWISWLLLTRDEPPGICLECRVLQTGISLRARVVECAVRPGRGVDYSETMIEGLIMKRAGR